MSSIYNEEMSQKARHDNLYRSLNGQNLCIDKRHWQKFESIEKHIHCYTFAVKSLGNVEGQRVLDLACGTGWFSVILAKRGALVEGVDISTEAIKVAQARAKVNDVASRVNFQPMSFYELRYPSNYFDKIIGLSVLHHSQNKDLLAEALYKVLKPGGRIVFNEPFGNSVYLEKLRLLVPVNVMEEDKSHWDEQIKYCDLEQFKSRFSVLYKEFQLFSRLDRVFKGRTLIHVLGLLDFTLLERVPWLRPYARDIVIVLDKPAC